MVLRSMISSPGSHAFSTCSGECSHKACRVERATAAAPCVVCVKPIGYETKFYDLRPPEEAAFDAVYGQGVSTRFVHFACVRDAAEAQRLAGVPA